MLASLLVTNNHYSLYWNFQSTCNENSLISDHWRMARTSTVTSSTCHFEGMYMFTNPAVFLNIVQKVGGGDAIVVTIITVTIKITIIIIITIFTVVTTRVGVRRNGFRI